MSKIKFLTESAADIPASEKEGLDILVLPFAIIMDGKEYQDGVSFTNKEFYKILAQADPIPSHSQITAFEFVEVYTDLYNQGYTDVIYMAINSKGSATHGNAVQAIDLFKEEHPEAQMNIHIIDSKIYTYAYGAAVVEGAKMARDGKPVEEIVAWMQDWADHVRILFAPYNLKFVKKSGRVSAAAAFAGDLLGLKPVLSFDNGDSVTLAKPRGDKKLISEMLRIMKSEMEEDSPYYVIKSDPEDKNQLMIDEAEKAIGRPCTLSYYVGGVIAINGGPDLTGLIYRKKSGV